MKPTIFFLEKPAIPGIFQSPPVAQAVAKRHPSLRAVRWPALAATAVARSAYLRIFAVFARSSLRQDAFPPRDISPQVPELFRGSVWSDRWRAPSLTCAFSSM